MYASGSGHHHRCRAIMLPPHEPPPPRGKFTVASVCALLTRDLFTIAKFLVLFLFLLFNLNKIPDVALRIKGQICDGCRRQAEEGKY